MVNQGENRKDFDDIIKPDYKDGGGDDATTKSYRKIYKDLTEGDGDKKTMDGPIVDQPDTTDFDNKSIDVEDTLEFAGENYTPGENAEKMMVVASGAEAPAQPLADAIADLKYKEALDKEAETNDRNRRRKNVDYVRQKPKEPTRTPSRGRGMRGMGR